MKRRTFIKKTGIASVALSWPVKLNSSSIRVAVIGSGLRGQSHINLLLKRDDIDLVAIAETDPVMIQRTRELINSHGLDQPKYYSDSEQSYLELLDSEELDLAIIATPWRWHTPMAIACVERNVYVGLEVSGAFSIEECWELVQAVENSDTHLYFLENVCFRRDVMAVLNMVRDNLFGEIIHCEGGYQHDLRAVKFNDGKQAYGGGVEFGPQAFSEARWRTQHSLRRNGELYPTHGIGPLAQYININRGNRFEFLTSMASKSRGLHEYVVNHEKGGEDHPNAQLNFALGDKVTTNIKCSNGETVVLHHDTSLPRPYSLGFRVQGTKGLWMDVNKSVHIEGLSPAHRWEDQASYMEKYDHGLWQTQEDKASGAGHGGMDYFMVNSLIEHVKRHEAPPFDVYDAASWMAITPLSERSIATGSSPQVFPDFTKGQWINRMNTFALNDQY